MPGDLKKQSRTRKRPDQELDTAVKRLFGGVNMFILEISGLQAKMCAQTQDRSLNDNQGKMHQSLRSTRQRTSQRDAMTNLDLSIVIPVFNEHDKIPQDIEQAAQFLTTSGLRGEILIVDDGSTDHSSDVARQTSLPSTVECRVITLDTNQGKGHAVKTGIIASSGECVLFADSGCCIPYGHAKIGLDLIREHHCAVALGSRRHPKSVIHRDQSLRRRLYSRAFRLVLNRLFPSLRPLHDTQCGFKVFHGDIARQLFVEATLEGFLFDLDIILLAQSRGHKVCEFPIEWTCDPDSRLSANRHTAEILREIRALWRKYKKVRSEEDKNG
jgi:dolichyl-phosphate beta-glucosyltransferase